MAWKSYHFRTPSLNGTIAAQFYVWLRTFMVSQGWELHDSGGATIPQWTFNGSSTISNNETVTIDGVVYTFKTTLTPAEGEVLIGGGYAAALDNLKLAINRTDPGTNDGVKYKIAAAHTLWEATTNTDTSQVIQWRGSAGNSVGNIPTLTDTCANMVWAAICPYHYRYRVGNTNKGPSLSVLGCCSSHRHEKKLRIRRRFLCWELSNIPRVYHCWGQRHNIHIEPCKLHNKFCWVLAILWALSKKIHSGPHPNH
jgi:hypothetical protein